MPVDFLEDVQAEIRAESREVALLEDERAAREQLAKALERRGLKVSQAESGPVAIDLAESSKIGVYVMDIQMSQGDMDGIDAARQIQMGHPFASFIFVTGFSSDPNYRQRVEEAGLRVGGWFEKPINEDRLQQLVNMTRKELDKVRMRISMAQAESRGIAPFDHLRSIALWDGRISTSSVEELTEELKKQVDPNARSENDLVARDAKIKDLYSEIRDLAARGIKEPDLKSKVGPLKEKLRALQEEEADEIEQRFDARLHLRPGSGWQVLELAKRLAGE